MLHLWERCIRTCRKRNQVIRIEIGNGTGIRAIATMLGRSASTISREIKRNTWFPSNENGSYRPYRPKRLKTGPWTGRYYIAGPAQRKAGRRRMKPRKPHRLSYGRLWTQVAAWLGCGYSPLLISGRLRVLWPDDRSMHVCPKDHLPMDLRRQATARALSALPASRPQAPPKTPGAQGIALRAPRARVHP